MNKWVLILAWLFAFPAGAAPLVADMSAYRIDMDAHFSGTRIFLFGARNEPGDVVVVVRGPERNYVLRKKEQIGGIWVNRTRVKLFDVPAFYALAASKPFAELEQGMLFRKLGIGEHNLITAAYSPGAFSNYTQYATAMLDHQRNRKQYAQNMVGIKFMGETLFKTAIEFPDNISPGQYTAEIYLVSAGKLIGQQTLPLFVTKTGVDAWLYDYAHNWPAFYGLMAVVIALAAGWFGGRIFEKI